MAGYLLKNGLVAELHPASVKQADLRIARGKIVARKKRLPRRDREKVVDLAGRIIMPGLVCAHTHLYSMLARGMAGPTPAPGTFLEILKTVWWKLDRALDEDAIYYSALVGAMEAAMAGTTIMMDHHASPNHIRGSLNLIREAIEEVGIRGVLCYEVTDRGGLDECTEGLKENREFLSRARNGTCRGLVGAHASFTLSEASLRACAELAKEFNSGVHIHVAEDPCDEEDAQRRYGKGIVSRLGDAGILTARCILAHGTHLSSADLDTIKKTGSWLIHNPRSNMNNAAGYAPVAAFGERSALGTDGIGSDMFAEVRAAFLKSRDGHGGLSPSGCLRLLSGGHALASEIFQAPLGSLVEGSAADLIILDYRSPTPLNGENLAGHLLFGMNAARVESVMVAGQFIVKNRRLWRLDTDRIYREAQKVARKLWAKI